MAKIRAWAAMGPNQKFVPYEYDPGDLKPDEVEIAVRHCGICHSDLSVLNNEWGVFPYPYVLGHEVVGEVVALGQHAKGLQIGQLVGVGWFCGSCMCCKQCIAGNQNLCPTVAATIIAHKGGFAEKVRAEWPWVVPLPKSLDPSSAGPLMCAGTTVFAPLAIYDIKATAHVGIIGLGGLGHLAIQFAKAWGCEVTVFTHTDAKHAEAKKLGADHVLSTTDNNAMLSMAGKLDLLIVAVNTPLDWAAFMKTLAPKGRIHFEGLVEKPIEVRADQLIAYQLDVSGTPTGAPSIIHAMLAFAERHGVAPMVEHFPMSQINEAFDYLKAGKPRYRVVLDADFH